MMKNVSTMIKEGYYHATITNVTAGKTAITRNGPERTIVVSFRTDQGEEVSSQLLMTSYSKLWKLLLEVTSLTEGKNLDLGGMRNKPCGIEVKHNFSGSAFYANVVDICHSDELIEDEDRAEA